MNAPILRTKLYQPVVRAELVIRPRLLERLTKGVSSKLLLVSAPAGYGKTTLLSAWAAHSGLPVAWLSLDQYDNDPERFMAYLVAAVQSIGASLNLDRYQTEVGTLQSIRPGTIEGLLPVWIEQLDAMASPFLLVLDDYHAIKNPEIHKAVAFLIDYQPPQMHLVITTREDPPLPISRLRARGQLTELRQADLRFTPEETAAFLSQWGSMELSAHELAVLADRTEGWVAGLQMAALALQRAQAFESGPDRNQAEIARIVASFGGSHEYIVDYFSAEVFTQQPEEIRTFLLQTSILDQLCGPLCEAVTGQPEGQQALEHLQKANLFVIALDQERRWFRYHHLFSDLLRKQLQQQAPETLPELHQRASRWYEENQMIDQAFQHAQAGGDQEKIGWIIDEYSEALWIQGDFSNLEQRINALTSDQLAERGEIINARAMIFALHGNYEEAERIFKELDQVLMARIAIGDQEELTSGMNLVRQPGHLLGLLAAARAQIAAMQGDPQAVLENARQALDIMAKYHLPWDIPWKCQVLISMGDAYLLTGDIPSAAQALLEAIPLGIAYHHDALLLEAMTKLAITYEMKGSLHQAAQTCQEALDHISQKSIEHKPFTAGLWIAWGWVQTERNELESALTDLLKGLRLSRSGLQQDFTCFANTALLRYWIAKGNLETAETYLLQAEMQAKQRKIPAWLDASLAGMKLLLRLKQGRLSDVDQELRLRGIRLDGDIRHPDPPLYYALARLSLARSDFSTASQVLDNLVEFAQGAGQAYWILRVWIARALMFLQQQKISQAVQALSMAVAQAALETNIQVFLDEGEPVSRLLEEMVRRQPGAVFANRLLRAFAQITLGEPDDRISGEQNEACTSPEQPDRNEQLPRAVPSAAAGGYARGAKNMLEPLTERELGILSLVAEGLSNQQIATRLYLSVRTVKFHTSNIYCKLDVESRTEAVARARQLKLID